MDYQIAILEAVKDACDLAETERWWIAYGKACGCPLTNLTDGGGVSADVIIERRRRKAEFEAIEAATLIERLKPAKRRYTDWEVEKRCYQIFSDNGLIDEAVEVAHGMLSNHRRIEEGAAAMRDIRDSVARFYARWVDKTLRYGTSKEIAQIEQRYFGILTALISRGNRDHLREEIATKTGITINSADILLSRWSRQSMERGRRALSEDRERLRLKIALANASKERSQ